MKPIVDRALNMVDLDLAVVVPLTPRCPTLNTLMNIDNAAQPCLRGGNTDAGAVFPLSTEQGAPTRAHSANAATGSVA